MIPRLSAEDLCKTLDNSDTDELNLDDYYPQDDLVSIPEDSSDELSEARSRFEGFRDKMRHIHFWRFSYCKLKQYI